MKKANPNRLGWILFSPSLLILGAAGLFPFIYVIYVGAHSWNVFSKERGAVFIGLQNYRELVFDSPFLGALSRTLLFSVLVVSIELVLGFLLALSLLKDFRGKTFFRTIYTLPIVVAPIAVGTTWRLMFAQGNGPIPFVLEKALHWNVNTGTSTTQAWIAIILMDVWHWTPLVALLGYAGLRSIPDAYYQAARIDGASKFAVFRYIQLPKMRGVLMIAVLLRFMDSFMIYTEPFVLTGGGPGNAKIGRAHV